MEVRGDQCEVGPKNGDSHALPNHDVYDHAIGYHEIDRSSNGKTDQSEPRTDEDHNAGNAVDHEPNYHTQDQVKPMNGDNHELHDRAVNDHVIEYHEIEKPDKGRTNPSGMEDGNTGEEPWKPGLEFP